jgi:hypothetical protein
MSGSKGARGKGTMCADSLRLAGVGEDAFPRAAVVGFDGTLRRDAVFPTPAPMGLACSGRGCLRSRLSTGAAPGDQVIGDLPLVFHPATACASGCLRQLARVEKLPVARSFHMTGQAMAVARCRAKPSGVRQAGAERDLCVCSARAMPQSVWGVPCRVIRRFRQA